MREHYRHVLADLESELAQLGTDVQSAVHAALWALEHESLGFAKQVITNDSLIDQRRYALERSALDLIARQQPLARDLRLVSTILSLASELERIGDYAEGIAELVLRCASLPPLILPEQIAAMATQSQAMLKAALSALHQRDAQALERLEADDNVVDDLYRTMTAWAFTTMREQPAVLERATYYLWVAHNLERIADRTINIAEGAVFISTGTVD